MGRSPRVAGDLDIAWRDAAWGLARPWGSLLNGVAIVLFVVNTARSLSRGARPSPGP